jgi:hypothetical protein
MKVCFRLTALLILLFGLMQANNVFAEGPIPEVAVIMDHKLRDMVLVSTLKPCENINVEAGRSIETHFFSVMKSMFEKVKFYGSKEEFSRTREYADVIVQIMPSADVFCNNIHRTCPIEVDFRVLIIEVGNNNEIADIMDGFFNYQKKRIFSTNCGRQDLQQEFDYAADQASMILRSRLNNYQGRIVQIAHEAASLRALPSSLSLAIAFSDKGPFSPNNLLDAGETAQIIVTVKNDGKGAGYNTILKLSSDNPKVTFDKEISLGDVAPGETKNIKVNVKAALDLTDGTVPFTVTCSEKRGYDCKKYNLNVSSAHFEKPGLMIAGYKINDSNTGLGQGNGNGIPENGEIIEIIPLVKNTGTGPALGVTLSIASISDGIEVKNKNVTIPQILPGQTASGNLSFFIPSTFSGKSIEVTFNAIDTRGVSGSKVFALNTAINQPSLAYAYRIIDQKGNTRSDMQNGESGEIEIRPSNKGQFDAKNVSISLSSDTFSFSKSQDEIMRIGAQSEYTPIRFPFHVPRVTDKNSVNVAVKLTQKDFPGLTDTINVPLRLARPDLKVTHQVIGTLQQGQAADLIVRVENAGQLDADGVTLSLDITKKGVLLHGNKQIALGKIEAGRSSEPKKFTLTVQRIADTGELPVQYTVTEKTFGTKNLTLALNITKEQAETITVKGEERPRPAVAASSYQNQPPMIAIAAPYNGEKTASESIALRGVAKDGKGIQAIEVSINGRRLDVSGRG